MERLLNLRNAANTGAELTKELDSVADTAFKLQKQLASLAAASQATYAEKSCQADLVQGPQYRLDRARRLASFAFAPLTAQRQLDWPKIRATDIEQLVDTTDTRSVMEIAKQLHEADLEAESSFNLTESNLLKLVQLSQLAIQYLTWCLEQSYHHQEAVQEERAAMRAGLQLVPDMSLKAVESGLAKLGKDYSQLSANDLDNMFTQVRAQERSLCTQCDVEHNQDQDTPYPLHQPSYTRQDTIQPRVPDIPQQAYPLSRLIPPSQQLSNPCESSRICLPCTGCDVVQNTGSPAQIQPYKVSSTQIPGSGHAQSKGLTEAMAMYDAQKHGQAQAAWGSVVQYQHEPSAHQHQPQMGNGHFMHH